MNKIIFSNQDIDFMIEKYKNNEMTTIELGKHFNCSRSTIERRLKEAGVTLKPVYKYQNLTGEKFGHLTVIKENKIRYEKDLQHTNKPHRYWFCQCDCGNTELVEVESSHLKSGHTTSCGCIKSLAEQQITKLLIQNNISFKSEYTFSDLKGVNGGALRYDFAILNQEQQPIYLIEYHGKQHYQQNGGWNTPQEFLNRQANDKLKEDYALNHNLPLIIIPYTVHPNKITINHILLSSLNKKLGEENETLA